MQSTPSVRFPLWVLVPNEESQSQQYLPAFSEADAMVKYLVKQPFGRWRTFVVDHDTLVLFISDMHQNGCVGLCVDPPLKGDGGIEVSLSELMKLT
jgi:hypothetical protein